MKSRLSDYLLGYEGKNPFKDRKSSSFGDSRIAIEFSPTSKYWSLFNDQHEVLLGTRGSGKTVLMRMLSYNCLKLYAEKSKNPEAQSIINNKSYIGFYIPMHLEFAAALQNEKQDPDMLDSSFSFAMNCMAACGLLNQLPTLIRDCAISELDKLTLESTVIDHLTKWWLPGNDRIFRDLQELQETILHLFQTAKEGTLLETELTSQLARPVLRPIVNVLNRLAELLRLNADSVRWLACIDEAEFLRPAHIKAINSFLRDEKRPLVVKMATLPFAHSTRSTLYEGIDAEADDFAYNWIDLEWDSEDFREITDHICRTRISSVGDSKQFNWSEFAKTGSLVTFVGKIGHDDQIDYFRAEVKWKTSEWTEESMLEKIYNELSPKRKLHKEESGKSVEELRNAIVKRFRPVLFMRLMKREQRKGNRTVGWFAGAETIRRIADGNPRLFIQIMSMLIEASRHEKMTPKAQHRKLTEFCIRRNQSAQGLPRHGVTLKALIDEVAKHLEQRVHGVYMLDGGCHFSISEDLLKDESISEALKVAISYSFIRIPDLEAIQFSRFGVDTDFRLGHSYAVEYWLPFRKGDAPCIRAGDSTTAVLSHKAPLTKSEADTLIRQLRLCFDEE